LALVSIVDPPSIKVDSHGLEPGTGRMVGASFALMKAGPGITRLLQPVLPSV
jgi:hypothetical protein